MNRAKGVFKLNHIEIQSLTVLKQNSRCKHNIVSFICGLLCCMTKLKVIYIDTNWIQLQLSSFLLCTSFDRSLQRRTKGLSFPTKLRVFPSFSLSPKCSRWTKKNSSSKVVLPPLPPHPPCCNNQLLPLSAE